MNDFKVKTISTDSVRTIKIQETSAFKVLERNSKGVHYIECKFDPLPLDNEFQMIKERLEELRLPKKTQNKIMASMGKAMDKVLVTAMMMKHFKY